MNKRCMLLATLLLVTLSLFAAPVIVTWDWKLEDPKLTAYRYQIDGEDPDQWTVVDASVTSYTVKGLDGSQAYTLYLQQSYDGENFSESAISVAEPFFPQESQLAEVETEAVLEPEMTEEEAVPEAEEMMTADAEPGEEEIVIADAEPVEEEPVVEEVAPSVVAEAPVAEKKAKADSRFKTTITLGGRFSNAYGNGVTSAALPVVTKNLQAELGLQFKNMMTFNNTFGLGMDIGIGYTPYLASSRGWRSAVENIFSDFSGVMGDFTHAVTFTAAPMLNMELGKVAFDLGGGAFVTYGPTFDSTKGKPFMYGAFAKLGLAYQINDSFSIGMDAKYNLVLVDFNDLRKFAEAGVYLGFSF